MCGKWPADMIKTTYAQQHAYIHVLFTAAGHEREREREQLFVNVTQTFVSVHLLHILTDFIY